MPTDHDPDHQPDADWRFTGFAIPTTTPVPDQLFDELMPRLSPAELVITLYIVRRTFGFKKASDTISLRQLTEGITTRDGRVLDGGTGLSKATVARALNSLEEKGVIVRERNRSEQRGDQPTTYRLNFLTGVSHFATPPLSQSETPRVASARHPVSHQRDTQQTVEQQTDVVFSKSESAPFQSNQGTDPSKFRKASSKKSRRDDSDSLDAGIKPQQTIQARIGALPDAEPAGAEVRAKRRMQSLGELLTEQNKERYARPGAGTIREPRTVAQPEQATNLVAGEATTGPASELERDAIRAYLADYVAELGDRAPFKSSMTRVVHIYQASAMTIAAFTVRMDSARRRTRATPGLRNKFSYWLALLEEESGLREPPPKLREAARRNQTTKPAPDQEGPAQKRKSLAGKYSHLVQH